jgi:hypothetical protein
MREEREMRLTCASGSVGASTGSDLGHSHTGRGSGGGLGLAVSVSALHHSGLSRDGVHHDGLLLHQLLLQIGRVSDRGR